MNMSNESMMHLSAFMDGESSEIETKAALGGLADAGSRRSWARYHLMRDIIRGDLPRTTDPAFAARVSSALIAEPTVLRPGRTNGHRWQRPALGAAIAATVAAVAILATQERLLVATGDMKPGAPAFSASITEGAQVAQPVSVAAMPVPEGATLPIPVAAGSSATPGDFTSGFQRPMLVTFGADGVPVASPVAPSQSRLNSYIMNYSEQRAMLGSPGVLPYAKVVGYSPEN